MRILLSPSAGWRFIENATVAKDGGRRTDQSVLLSVHFSFLFIIAAPDAAAAQPLANRRTSHKARSLVSTGCGETSVSDASSELFVAASSVTKVNVVPGPDVLSSVSSAYAEKGTLNDSAIQKDRRSLTARRKPLVNVCQLNSIGNAAFIRYSLLNLRRGDNRTNGIACRAIFGK